MKSLLVFPTLFSTLIFFRWNFRIKLSSNYGNPNATSKKYKAPLLGPINRQWVSFMIPRGCSLKLRSPKWKRSAFDKLAAWVWSILVWGAKETVMKGGSFKKVLNQTYFGVFFNILRGKIWSETFECLIFQKYCYLELVVDHLFSESPRSANSHLDICQRNPHTWWSF